MQAYHAALRGSACRERRAVTRDSAGVAACDMGLWPPIRGRGRQYLPNSSGIASGSGRNSDRGFVFYATLPSQGGGMRCGNAQSPVVLDSVKQVKNAFRFGAIDEKRYNASLARVTKTASRVGANRRDRLAILARTKFAPSLPTDAQLKPSRNVGRMVPHPKPDIMHAKDLTPDQQAMYLKAFRDADNLELIEWYSRFRLDSVLRSVILFTNRCDLALLAEEAEALGCLGSVQDGCGWLGAPPQT